MVLQELIALVLVGLAVLYLAATYVRSFVAKRACGSGCGTCHASEPEKSGRISLPRVD